MVTQKRLALVLAAVVCAYAPVAGSGFTWDDEYVLVRNEPLRDLGNLPRFFTDAGTSVAGAEEGAPVHYRPLRATLFALAFRAWGMEPLGYHLLNLLLHLVNVLLVYSLARRLLGDEGPALLVSALFGLHPLATEAVAGVVGLGDLLSAAFLLGAFRSHLELTHLGRAEWPRVAGVVALFVGALLSKETAVVFPALVLLHDQVIMRLPWRGSARRIAYGAGLLMLAGGFLAVRAAVLGGMGAGRWEGITFARTMWMQADVLARYLRLLVWPAGLSIRHDIPVPVSFFEPRTVLSTAVLVGVLALIVASWRRAPLVAFGLGWFFASLAPVMNLVPLKGSRMGERFCYVPMIGAFVALAAGRRLLARPGTRLGAGTEAVTVALLLPLAAVTFVRLRDWRDDVTLFEAAARVSPGSNLVRLKLIQEYERRGREDLAAVHRAAGAANARALMERYLTIGERAETSGSVGEAGAWYRRVLGIAPGEPRAVAGIRRLAAPREGE